MRTPSGRSRGTDAGFTVVEVTIVMAIAMVVMGSLLGLLSSQSNAAARVETFVGDQEQVRLTLLQMQRDLRSAHEIIEPPPAADRGSSVEVELYESPETTTPSRVRWRLTGSRQLVREVEAPDGSVRVSAVLEGVTRPDAGLFTYFSAHREEPLSALESSSTIADCTVRIRVDLRAAPTPRSSIVNITSDVQLRNRIHGRTGC